MFWCFDDAKGSSASKFYSRQESKNPRNQDIWSSWSLESLGRSFQIKNKQKVWPKNSIISNWDLLSGNRLPAAENVYNSH